MWDSDREWLYLRRPEGVWKPRIAEEFDADTPIFLCQRLADASGEVDIVGMMSLDRSIAGHRGWVRGHSVDQPMDAADRDDEALPESHGLSVDADAVAFVWGALVGEDGGRLLVDGGDFFDRPPTFELVEDWLLATDTASGRRVGYPLRACRSYREALEAGNLWMRLGGRWANTIDIDVKVS